MLVDKYQKKLLKASEIGQVIKDLRTQGQKVVFTYGTFDLVHGGQGAYLLNARMQGDALFVGIASNSSQRELRGNGFPLIDQKNRAELISYFDFVDYTVIADKQNLLPVLKKIKPDIFYTTTRDWKSHLRKSEEEKFIKSYGGRIVKIKKHEPYVSSSDIVERVADLKIKEIVEYFFGKVNIDLSTGNWKQNKFSGLKTDVRSDYLHFGDHSEVIDMFSRKFFGEIVNLKTLKSNVNKLREQGKKIVLSSGACDLLHAGHIRFFLKAKEQGDVLVLAIPSNRIIRKQKGRGRPIVDQYSRAELMSFFGFIDYIIVHDEESILPLMEEIDPDVFFTVEEEWNEVGKEKKKIGKWDVVTAPPQSTSLSSSKLIKKAAGLRVHQVFKEVLESAKKMNTLKD